MNVQEARKSHILHNSVYLYIQERIENQCTKFVYSNTSSIEVTLKNSDYDSYAIDIAIDYLQKHDGFKVDVEARMTPLRYYIKVSW